MATTSKYVLVLKRLGLILLLAGVILAITWIAQQFGSVTNSTTVAFSFLILITLSAVFADLAVALSTSIVATMCFNYFFLPPIGTFFIAAFDDWVALFVFLCTAIVISKVTASAHENAVSSATQAQTLENLKEFSQWLLSQQRDQVTLSGIAEAVARIFSLPYCSIHIQAAGKWQHLSGSSSYSDLSDEVEKKFKSAEEYPTRLLDLVDEAQLGVRFSQIMRGSELVAVLVVKDDTLPATALNTLACMIGALVLHTMEVK